jgi:hypothetical protein
VRVWAQVQPALANVDLRPYLFVTKDRKDYFGAVSVLGHLVGVVEKLFGPKLTMQRLEAELKKLAPPEAAEVFVTDEGALGTPWDRALRLLRTVRDPPCSSPVDQRSDSLYPFGPARPNFELEQSRR